MSLKYCFPGLIFLIYACCSCTGQNESKATVAKADSIIKPLQQGDISLPGGFSNQNNIRFDSLAIPAFINQYPGFKPFENSMRRFYARRNYAYAWFENNGLIEQAGNLYNKVININEEGLPVKLLYEDAFHKLMDEDSTGEGIQKPDPAVELMITAQYFFYAKNAWTGLGTKAMQAVNWDLPQKKLTLEGILDSLVSVPSSQFMTTEPFYPQYALLKTYLKKYRDIEASGGWSIIIPDKKIYRKGDSSIAIAAIRKRLYQGGDLSADDQSAVYNEELKNGVKKFQQRYGFKEDGVISSALINEMNYPVQKRIEQIIVNMERCRWLPVDIKGDYFVVNIPEYRFHAFEHDTLAWSMNVVVGSAMNKTAVFSGMMNTVVFSPYWNIPPGIMKNETLPAIKRNKNYLEKNHMEWNGNGVRQKPGPWNALGKVKFLFPNSHSIYLHDTPSKSAFDHDLRAFSHGCIRVSDPKRLAIYVLRKQPEWTEHKIETAMNASKEQYVKIDNPVPVYITYLTSWVDANGKLNFRNDIYKRDSRLAQMIIDNAKL